MTPDPTPQPAHDHGAAGFCTDHAKALDERGEYRCRRDPACTDRWWPPSHSQRCAEENRAAGFCTDHGQPAARPTTVAEAVEVAYRAHLEARKGAPLAPGEFEATRSRVETKWMAAVLEAVGYAALLAEVGRLRDEAVRTERLESRIVDILEAERDEARAALAALRASVRTTLDDWERGAYRGLVVLDQEEFDYFRVALAATPTITDTPTEEGAR